MKRTERIELRRNIMKTIVTFLSISVIVMLGISTYLGINYASKGLLATSNKQYQEEQFSDFEIQSALGLTDADVAAAKAIDGVKTAVGIYEVSGTVTFQKANKKISVSFPTKDVNQYPLLKGEYPSKQEECVIDNKTAETLGIQVSDVVEITAKKNTKTSYLNADKYTVTGVISCLNSTKTTGYILIQKENFDVDAIGNCYTNMLVKLDSSQENPTYDVGYKELAKKLQEEIEAAGKVQAQKRYETLKADMQEQIDSAQKKLDDAKTKIDDAKTKIENAEKEIANNEAKIPQAEEKLAVAKTKIDQGEVQLAEGEKQLAEGEQQLAEGQAQLSDAQVRLADAKAKIDAYETQLADGKVKAEDAKRGTAKKVLDAEKNDSRLTPEEQQELQTKYDETDFSQPIDSIMESLLADVEDPAKTAIRDEMTESDKYIEGKQAEQELIDFENMLQVGKEEYDKKVLEYNAGYEKYQTGFTSYQAGLATYNEKLVELETGKTQYQDGLQQLEDGKKQIEEAKATLAEKKIELETQQKNYEKQEKLFQDKKQKADDFQSASWFVMGRNTSSSYAGIQNNANNLAGLGFTFALTLIIVAALVCYSSIGRMITEQKTLLGAQKALGFTRKEILKRYMAYALISTAIGLLVGIPIAYFGIQSIALNAYKVVHGFDVMEKVFLIKMTVIVVVAALLIAMIATWLACKKLLHISAVELMRDDPQAGNANGRKKFNIYKKMSLYKKLIISNMFCEKVRVFMTIVGVTGCATLLVMGFSLKISTQKVPDYQYHVLTQYDKEITVDTTVDEDAMAKTGKEISDIEGVSSIPVYSKWKIYRINGTLSKVKLIGTDAENFRQYFALYDYKTREKINLSDDGILLSQGLAKEYNLQVGDTICTLDNRGKEYMLEIGGIFENYVGQEIIISPDYYKKVYGSTMSPKTYWVKLNGTRESILDDKVATMGTVKTYKDADETRKSFEQLTGTLNIILVLLIIMSIIMALMVLLNLAMMNVNQKSRELVIMRVNGFTLRETKEYLIKDTTVITVAGIILAIILGTILSGRICHTLENSSLQLMGGIQPMAWLIAVLITVIFSVIINSIALRKIKFLKLTDIK